MTSILCIDGKKQVMSTPTFAVYEETTIKEVVSLMMNRHISRIRVSDERTSA